MKKKRKILKGGSVLYKPILALYWLKEAKVFLLNRHSNVRTTIKSYHSDMARIVV